jgi:hypothetical protein
MAKVSAPRGATLSATALVSSTSYNPNTVNDSAGASATVSR